MSHVIIYHAEIFHIIKWPSVLHSQPIEGKGCIKLIGHTSRGKKKAKNN